jgi:hypothetical protein
VCHHTHHNRSAFSFFIFRVAKNKVVQAVWNGPFFAINASWKWSYARGKDSSWWTYLPNFTRPRLSVSSSTNVPISLRHKAHLVCYFCYKYLTSIKAASLQLSVKPLSLIFIFKSTINTKKKSSIASHDSIFTWPSFYVTTLGPSLPTSSNTLFQQDGVRSS